MGAAARPVRTKRPSRRAAEAAPAAAGGQILPSTRQATKKLPGRDWANLADGPAGLIADRVLAYDVADYVRFRAVCHPWRHCCTDPRSHTALDRRFHPSSWTMLREELAAAPDRRCFLNTSTGECVNVHIPELNHHNLLALTAEGLLVLVRDRQHIRLLNPLTRHLTHLPPLTTLVPPEQHKNLLEDHIYFDGRFTAWGSGIASDGSTSTVVLCFDRLGMIGLAKPGDDSWKLLRYRRDGMTVAPLMFQGRFYSMNSVHLVNNVGELLLVHRRSSPMTARNKSRRCYDTYRVDLETGTRPGH